MSHLKIVLPLIVHTSMANMAILPDTLQTGKYKVVVYKRAGGLGQATLIDIVDSIANFNDAMAMLVMHVIVSIQIKSK